MVKKRNRTVGKTRRYYEMLRLLIGLFRQLGYSDNLTRKALGLNSSRFHCVIHRELTLEEHKWEDKEVHRLISLYAIHSTDWRTITNVLNAEFGIHLTGEQVKNKWYSSRKSKRYQNFFKDIDIPKLSKGRKAQFPPIDEESGNDDKLENPVLKKRLESIRKLVQDYMPGYIEAMDRKGLTHYLNHFSQDNQDELRGLSCNTPSSDPEWPILPIMESKNDNNDNTVHFPEVQSNENTECDSAEYVMPIMGYVEHHEVADGGARGEKRFCTTDVEDTQPHTFSTPSPDTEPRETSSAAPDGGAGGARGGE